MQKLSFTYCSFMDVESRLFSFSLQFYVLLVSYFLVSLLIKLNFPKSFNFLHLWSFFVFHTLFQNNVHPSWIATFRTGDKTPADTLLMLNAAERLLHVFWNNLLHLLSLISSDKKLSDHVFVNLKRKTWFLIFFFN